MIRLKLPCLLELLGLLVVVSWEGPVDYGRNATEEGDGGRLNHTRFQGG
jgi:hypothetical protein